jgi:hypothetical protein
MPGGGKHTHAQTDLSDHHLSHPASDTPDGHDQIQHAGVRAEQHLDPLIGLRDQGLEKIDMGEHLRDQQAMVLAPEPMSQRLAQCRDLGAQPALGQLGQLGQHRRVVLPGQQCGQDRPTGLAQDR